MSPMPVKWNTYLAWSESVDSRGRSRMSISSKVRLGLFTDVPDWKGSLSGGLQYVNLETILQQ